jgi:hypothetical protein
VSLFFVTKGDTGQLTQDIRGTGNDICARIRQLLPTVSKADLNFVGARELIELASKPPKLDFTLKCSCLMQSPRGGFVALLPLTEYVRLITSDSGDLRTSLFESNVRDYQGAVAVNEAIERTLRSPGIEDFWWLNNGITIVAEKVSGGIPALVLGDPQIVNGLQTSQKIYDYFVTQSKASKEDTRELLVRIIQAPNPDSRDRIIFATNSQTAIPRAYLWATKQIHRDIENYFRNNDLYYDRRKNSWRRAGIPFDKVVGITELAQAVGAMLRQEPSEARSSPGRFFAEHKHKTVFSERYKLPLYVVCAKVKKNAAAFFRTVERDKGHRNNLIFYLMTAATCIALRTAKPPHHRIADLDPNKVNRQVFETALAMVRPIYDKYGATDQAAKGKEMTEDLLNRLRAKYPRRKMRKGK